VTSAPHSLGTAASTCPCHKTRDQDWPDHLVHGRATSPSHTEHRAPSSLPERLSPVTADTHLQPAVLASCSHIFNNIHTPWHSSNVVGRINEVTLRRARLVLGWVTVFGRQTTSVFHQATQANSASYPQRDGK